MDNGLGNSVNVFLDQEEALCLGQYLVDLDEQQTALRSGLSVQRVRNIIKKYPKLIQARVAERCAQFEVSGNRVLQELAAMAFFDPGDLYDANGVRKPIHELDERTRRAVGLEFSEGSTNRGGFDNTTVKYTPADKRAALELLGKYLKMFTDRVEVSGMDELAGRLNRARQRMQEGDSSERVRSGPGGDDPNLSETGNAGGGD